MAESKGTLESILKTLQYSSIFAYPLSFFQIATYMNKTVPFDEFQKSLKLLVKKKKLVKKKNIFKLCKAKCVNWDQKQVQTKKLIRRYSKIIKKLDKIPWIQMAAFTGSLAASNPSEGDDIDIFIITKKNRLWITRFFVVMYLKSRGTYRTEKDPKGKICPNLLISEKSLSWPGEKQNFYIAAEIVRMQPIINRDNSYLKFLSKNAWIKNYFPNFKFEEVEKSKGTFPNILDLVEIIFYIAQKSFMKSRITTEIISKNFIHFNKYDKTNEILQKYNSGVD